MLTASPTETPTSTGAPAATETAIATATATPFEAGTLVEAEVKRLQRVSSEAATALTTATQAMNRAKQAYAAAGLVLEQARLNYQRAQSDVDRIEQIKDASKQAYERVYAEFKAVYSESAREANRLLNFINFVTRQSIPPDLTAYAKEEWPSKPREFYAEAYAYYVLAPDRLKKHSQALFGYFASGGHLNDNPAH